MTSYKMASGGQNVVDGFQALACDVLAEQGRHSLLSIPDEVASREDVIKFLSWMHKNLTFAKKNRAENVRLKEELHMKQAQVDKMVKMHTHLGMHRAALADEQEAKKKEEVSSAVQLQKSLDNVSKSNTKFNSHLENVERTVTNIVVLHNDSLQPKDIAVVVDPFISRLPLQPYFESEHRFMSALTQYAKSQHLQSLACIINTSEEEETVFDLNSSRSFLIKGLPPEQLQKFQVDLKILQRILQETQLSLISSEGAERHLKAACEYLTKKLEDTTQSDIDDATDLGVLKEREAHIHQRMSKLKQELALMQQRLHGEVHTLAKLQVSKFAHRKCDLKLARLNYFISKQDKLIEGLNQQRSRYQVLSLLLQLELRKHHQTHRLLVVLQQQLDRWSGEFRERTVSHTFNSLHIKALRNPSLMPSRKPKVAVHSQDYTSQAVHSLLEGCQNVSPEDSDAILTYAGISSQLKTLTDKIAASEEGIKSNSMECGRRIAELERALATLHSAVFSDSTGDYEACNPDLKLHVDEMKGVLSEVQAKMRDSLHTRDMKKKMIEKDTILQQELTLFAKFMTNSEELQSVFAHLASQMNAFVRSSDQ